jgi:hypothetical protein
LIKAKKKVYANFFNAESVQYYRKNILDFVEDIIFHKNSIARGGDLFLTDQQKEMLLSIQKFKRVSIKSGRGVGKTAVVAFACIWFLCCYPSKTKFICTAPSKAQLKTGLWNEIGMWFEQSLVSSIFIIGAERISLQEHPNSCYAEGRTARVKESMSGIHADHLMIICDEASATDDDILNTLNHTMTAVMSDKSCKLQKMVCISNATRVNGFFFDTHNSKSSLWHTYTFSSVDSPLVDPEQIADVLKNHGAESPLYLVDVLGEFPPANADAFIPYSEVLQAMSREVIPEGDIEIGVDVARYGDDKTVVFWRHGYKVYTPHKLAKSSIPEVVDLVIKTVVEIRQRTKYLGIIKVKVDDSGVGGGCSDYLALDREHNIQVIPCNFGGAGNEIYQNEASSMWGSVKDVIGVISLPDDGELKEQLASRRWKLSNNGKIMIEPKSEFKKDFKKSPDLADALVLCFAKKENSRVLLKAFDPLDTEIVKSHLSYSGEEKIASIFYSKDLYTSIVYSAWDGRRLYIYDEYSGDDSIPQIAYDVYTHGQMSKILGNDKMFGSYGEDISSKFNKYGVKINENYNYNELGAIETLEMLITQKRLIINKKCEKTVQQLSRWNTEVSRKLLETEFGICYAIANIISFLKKKIDYTPKQIDIVPYSEQRQQWVKSFSKDTVGINKWLLN